MAVTGAQAKAWTLTEAPAEEFYGNKVVPSMSISTKSAPGTEEIQKRVIKIWKTKKVSYRMDQTV